jgi:hypothetical protein
MPGIKSTNRKTNRRNKSATIHNISITGHINFIYVKPVLTKVWNENLFTCHPEQAWPELVEESLTVIPALPVRQAGCPESVAACPTKRSEDNSFRSGFAVENSIRKIK